MHDADKAIEIIDKAIAEGLAEKNADAVEIAKQKVLNDYNFFELVVKNLQTMDASAKKVNYTIKEDMAFLDIRKFFIYGGRVFSNLKYKLTK